MSQLVIPLDRPARHVSAARVRMLAAWLQLGITLIALGGTLLPAGVLLQECFDRFGWPALALATPFAYALWGACYCLLIVALKRSVLGRRIPFRGSHPYFSLVVARWAFVTQLAKVAHQMFLTWVTGTEFIVWWYRLLGAKIGARVTINTVFVYDWDMLEIGDDTFVGGRSTLMAHVGQMGHVTFAPTRIGTRCTIGQDTTLLPGVVMEDESVLGANSLALEGQRFETGRVYLGVPARCVRSGVGKEREAQRSPRRALLDRNESAYPPAPGCLAALREVQAESLSRYAREERLRERIAEWIGLRSESVLLGLGAEGLLKTAFQSLLRQRDSVLLPDASWWYYDRLASSVGARVQRYPVREGLRAFSYEAGEIVERARATRSRLVILASPNNPTGNALPVETVAAVLGSLNDTPVVLDEAYWGYNATDNRALADLHARFPNLLVIRTFSKLFALPGIRMGFAVAGQSLSGFKEAAGVYLGHDSIAEAVATAALDDLAYYEAQAAQLRAEKARLIRASRDAQRAKAYDSDANFVLVRLDPAACEEFQRRLRTSGTSVRFFSDPPLERCARITLGTAEQNSVVLECLQAVEGCGSR